MADDTYAIQEVSKRSGLSIPTLRYYEEKGLIPTVGRDMRSGHRRYDSDTLQLIETLSNLRTIGMSIEDMRSYLVLRARGDETAVERRNMFMEHADCIGAEINKLKSRQKYLALKVAYWDARAGGDTNEAERIAEDYESTIKQLH